MCRCTHAKGKRSLCATAIDVCTYAHMPECMSVSLCEASEHSLPPAMWKHIKGFEINQCWVECLRHIYGEEKY